MIERWSRVAAYYFDHVTFERRTSIATGDVMSALSECQTGCGSFKFIGLLMIREDQSDEISCAVRVVI